VLSTPKTTPNYHHHFKRRKTAMSDPKSYLDWAEKAAMEHLKGRLATGDVLLTQANQLLNLLLAGMAGALAWGARVFTPQAGSLEWGAAAVSAYLAIVAAALTHHCISTRPTQAQYNEPRNIYKPELNLDLDVARKHELDNVQERIDLTIERNRNVAKKLDQARYATALTPLVFVLAALLAS
jgi:hypothetical protein